MRIIYMVYFVQKKNRCKNGECISYRGAYFSFANKCSQYTHRKTNQVTYANAFENNTTKRGSGGNSYAGYLARRVGQLQCSSCNTKPKNK